MSGRRPTGQAGRGPGSGGRLAFAGFLIIAVTYGPARNGYGLFLPQIREEFGLSTEVVGLIASGTYAGFMAALFAVALLTPRFGPRLPVVAGALSAASGMALVAWSQNTLTLAAGVILAATSAGWTWSPYNDAAERMVPAGLRARVLSIVSTGTTVGIAAAGVIALAAGEVWRASWIIFASFALIALIYNAMVLPDKSGDAQIKYWPGLRWFLRREAAPLFVVTTSFGVVSSIYWSFAVDHVSRNAEFPLPMGLSLGPLLFVVLGVGGVAGFFTGEALRRFGHGNVLRAVLFSGVVAATLLGIAPGLWPVATISALLFGVYVMTMAALISVWSSLVFPESPSTGFSATLLTLALGSVLAPVSMGVLAAAYGYGVVFLLCGAIAMLTMLVRLGE